MTVAPPTTVLELVELAVDVRRRDVGPRDVLASVGDDPLREEVEVARRAAADKIDSGAQFDAELLDGLLGADAAFRVDEVPLGPSFCVRIVLLRGAAQVQA